MDTIKQINPEQPLRQYDLVDPLSHAELLNSVSVEIGVDEVSSHETQHLIREMRRIAAGKDEEGGAQMVGLAAPQVGVSKRLCLIDLNATGMREEQNLVALINPRITGHSESLVDGREGCWSAGKYCANVPRYDFVIVEALSADGKTVTLELEGFVARIAQHEIDHLDGIRCIDRVPEGEDWRLHRVDVSDKEEFDRYRHEWPTWSEIFRRSEWELFREGVATDGPSDSF